MHTKERFMVMNKFDDSLDGSITKPNKQTPLLSKMNKNLNKIIDNAPNIPVSISVLTNDEVVLRVLRKKGKVYASWLSDYLGMPERTTGYTLKKAIRKYEILTKRLRTLTNQINKTYQKRELARKEYESITGKDIGTRFEPK